MKPAMEFAKSADGHMRVKALAAVGVTCAELRNSEGVATAVSALKVIAISKSEGGIRGDDAFDAMLQFLNISAALIEHDQFAQSSELLDFVTANEDEISSISLDADVQLDRLVILAKQGEFASARVLALKIKPDSISEAQRGTALRTVAFLETKASGPANTRAWAIALSDPEDRAYALIGIAQALTGTGDIKLPYSAFNVH